MTDFTIHSSAPVIPANQRETAAAALTTYFTTPNDKAQHAIVSQHPEINNAVVVYQNMTQINGINEMPDAQKTAILSAIQNNLINEVRTTGDVDFNKDNEGAIELIQNTNDSLDR